MHGCLKVVSMNVVSLEVVSVNVVSVDVVSGCGSWSGCGYVVVTGCSRCGCDH